MTTFTVSPLPAEDEAGAAEPLAAGVLPELVPGIVAGFLLSLSALLSCHLHRTFTFEKIFEFFKKEHKSLLSRREFSILFPGV